MIVEDSRPPSAALYDELSGNHYRDIYRDASEIRYGGESGEKKRALDLYQEPGYPAVS